MDGRTDGRTGGNGDGLAPDEQTRAAQSEQWPMTSDRETGRASGRVACWRAHADE